MRRHLVRFGHVDEVVLVVRIAQFDDRQRGFGELGFQIHHGGGLFRRVVLLHADEFERFGDVGDIRFADLLRVVVGLEVVVALGKSESALARVGDHVARIVEVRVRAEAEHERHSLRGVVADEIREIVGRIEAIDALEIILDRSEPGFFDRRFVHAGGVEIADLLFDRTRRIFRFLQILGDARAAR